MRVAVVGAGATGCLFAARLAGAGHSVELVGRPESVAAIRRDGLRVEGTAGGTVRVAARSDLALGDGPDALFVTVKTYDVASATEGLARSGTRPKPLLLTQNGLGVERTATDALTRGGWPEPGPWLVRAVHSVPATLVAPGVVREGGRGDVLLPAVGPSPSPSDPPSLFAELLRGAGFTVRTVVDLDREVWRKALVNAAINPVSALLGVPNGDLVHDPGHARALELLREARVAAGSAGYAFEEREVEADFERVVRETAANRSSMLQDLDRGRPTEIDAISGEILRVGTAHGLDLPATRRAVEEIRQRSGGRPARPQPS